MFAIITVCVQIITEEEMILIFTPIRMSICCSTLSYYQYSELTNL